MRLMTCAAGELDSSGDWVDEGCYAELDALIDSGDCSAMFMDIEDRDGNIPAHGIIGSIGSTGKFWAYYVIPTESTKLKPLSW
jgi:hypothetical protein